MPKFLSGRQKSLKLGVKDFTNDERVLEILGKVGVGTNFSSEYTVGIGGSVRVDGSVSIGGTFDAEYVGVGTISVETLDVNSISIGSTLGDDGQYVRSTGTGVTWASFPTLRTGFSTVGLSSQTQIITSYNIDFLDVFVNGVLLNASEYQAIDGFTITFNDELGGGEIIDIFSYNTTSNYVGGSGGGGGTINIGGDSLWTESVVGIYTNTNVGINSDYPENALSVVGDVKVVGVVTALTFIGDGSGLTNITATGSGVEVRDSGSVVGTAATIDFGDNINVSPISAGVVTVSSSSGGITGAAGTTGNIQFNDGGLLGANNAFTFDAAQFRLQVQNLQTNVITTTNPTLEINTNTEITGILTATQFVGDGSGLTNITATGSGVQVKDNGVTVGTASTIDFGNNLSVSLGSGIATVTAQASAYADNAGIATIATYTSEWTLGANGIQDYTFSGPGLTGAENDPTLYLVRGQKYKFTNAMGAHPFRIQSTTNGSVGTQYNDGITNNDISNGTLFWDVQFDSPNKLYYQCTSHSDMGGVIHILDESGSGGGGSIAGIDTSNTSTFKDVRVTGVITATQINTQSAGTPSITSPNNINLNGNIVAISTDVTIGRDAVISNNLNVTGILTATSFSGSGSGLTNIPAGQLTGNLPAIDGSALLNVTAAGTGVTIEDDTVNVGSATTIDFGTGLNVAFSSGIATITSSGGGGISNVVEDTTPQLGGDLDVNSNDITGTGNINLTGVITATSFVKSSNSGGFLKADGTEDTNTYLTSYTETQTLDDVLGLGNVSGIGLSVGVITATSFDGNAGTATSLETAKNFSVTGDFVTAPAVSFDGTGAVALAATITADSITLGTYTSGDYVESVSGTANEIEVTGGTGEGSTPTIGFAANPTIGGNVNIGQDLTVTRDLQVTRNLNVDGIVTIGGTSATIFAETLKISDPDLILGVRTDAGGNDISNDTTANHGGIAIASTEGTPLVTLVNPGAGETLPSTYKKIMWFKTNSFTGLNTDTWLSNYAFGVGTTSMSSGTKFAVGNIEANFDDFTSVRHINSSGVGTFTTLDIGTGGIDVDGHTELDDLNVSGVVTATSFVKSGGTSSQFLKADGSVDSNTYLTSFIETNDLSSAVTWANVPDANITESSVTQHQAAIGITESQISDLQSYLTSYTETQTLDDVLGLGNVSGIGLSVGVVTATSFVKESNSGGFLKADGTEDTGTYFSTNGNFTKDSGSLTFKDNIKVYFGDSNQDDSTLYHDGTDTRIENRTGDLVLETIDTGEGGSGDDIIIKAGTGKTSIFAHNNGAVELWNNGSKKLETTGAGVTVTGILTATSFVKSSNSGGFLKADGTEDTNTYLTSYTETQTLDDVLGLGNVSGIGLSVGVVTATSFSGDGSGLTNLPAGKTIALGYILG